MFERPHFSGSSHAGLHFIHDQHDSVLTADALQFLQEELRRWDITALTLNRFDDDSRHFRWIEQAFENLFLERLQDFCAARLRRMTECAAIRVRIRNVLYTAEQRAKSLALCRLRCRQRQRTHRASVEAAVKCNHLVALCGITSELN